MRRFRAYDKDEKCLIPPNLIAITGEGVIMTRDDENSEWVEETIPIDIYFVKEDGSVDIPGIQSKCVMQSCRRYDVFKCCEAFTEANCEDRGVAYNKEQASLQI